MKNLTKIERIIKIINLLLTILLAIIFKFGILKFVICYFLIIILTDFIYFMTNKEEYLKSYKEYKTEKNKKIEKFVDDLLKKK